MAAVMDFEYVVRDSEVKRLHIRVRPTGGKHFEVMKKINGRQPRQKVCKFGDHLKLTAHKVPKGEAPPETVRSRANRLIVELESGVTPSQKRAERRENESKAKAEQVIEERASRTLFQATEDYIERAELAEGTKNNYTSYLNKHLGDWSDKPLASLTVDDVMVMQAHIKAERGPVAANNALRLFRAVWNVEAEDNPEMGLCPTYVLSKKSKKKVKWANETRRDRYVHATELQPWWDATERLRNRKHFTGDGNLMADYFQWALLTGMRRAEISNIQWKDISRTRKELVSTKNKAMRKWTLPLTPALTEILDRREGAEADKPFDVHEPRRAINRVIEWSGVEWSMHDLRRSFASHSEATRMPMKTLKLLMNHATGDDVTMGYIHNNEVMRFELIRLQSYILSNAMPSATNTETKEVVYG